VRRTARRVRRTARRRLWRTRMALPNGTKSPSMLRSHRRLQLNRPERFPEPPTDFAFSCHALSDGAHQRRCAQLRLFALTPPRRAAPRPTASRRTVRSIAIDWLCPRSKDAQPTKTSTAHAGVDRPLIRKRKPRAKNKGPKTKLGGVAARLRRKLGQLG
jgi:hypothetical protein